jgi:hypothetical protein
MKGHEYLILFLVFTILVLFILLLFTENDKLNLERKLSTESSIERMWAKDNLANAQEINRQVREFHALISKYSACKK